MHHQLIESANKLVGTHFRFDYLKSFQNASIDLQHFDGIALIKNSKVESKKQKAKNKTHSFHGI